MLRRVLVVAASADGCAGTERHRGAAVRRRRGASECRRCPEADAALD